MSAKVDIEGFNSPFKCDGDPGANLHPTVHFGSLTVYLGEADSFLSIPIQRTDVRPVGEGFVVDGQSFKPGEKLLLGNLPREFDPSMPRIFLRAT